MAFKIKRTLEIVHGHLAASGYLRHVQVGEPKQPPVGVSAGIFMDAVSISQLTLNGTIESHSVLIRLYENRNAQTIEATEFRLDEIGAELTTDFKTDYSLGGNIRNVDFGGAEGPAYSERLGYVDISGVDYRVLDILLPVIVDDSASLAA